MEIKRAQARESREASYWRRWLRPPLVYWLLGLSILVLLGGWPLLRSVVVLANCDPGVRGWRVEQYPQIEPQGRPQVTEKVTGDHLWLRRPDTSLVAYTFWRANRAGKWRLRAKLDGYARVWVEDQPVLFFTGREQPQLLESEFTVPSPGLYIIKAVVWIQAPEGYLGIRALGPDDPDYRLLDQRDLIYPDLDLDIWAGIRLVMTGVGWAGLGLGLLGLAWSLWRRRR